MTTELDAKVVARFWSKVDQSGDCWLWTGSKDKKGYGFLKVSGRTPRAHRVSFTIAFGPIPKGVLIDHYKCYNPSCVRPAHLRAATYQQNNANRSGATVKSKTGIRGVHWHKATGKWVAKAQYKGQDYSGGYYDTLEEAEKAAIQLRERLFN